VHREYRSLPIVNGADTTPEGRVRAIVSVFGIVDSYGTRILPGAFRESLARRLPVGVWAHDWTQPVARAVEARELGPGDPLLPESVRPYGGLYVDAQFNLDTQRGRDAFSDLANGIITEFSIGFSVDATAPAPDLPDVVDIAAATLYEFSPVVAGANPATSVIDIREAPTESPAPGNPPAGTLGHEAATVRDAARRLHERINALARLRATEGRDLNAVNCDRLTTVARDLRGLADEMDALARAHDTADPLVLLQLQARAIALEV